jgi:nucleoside-diphosphate-sugar epimerase
MSASKVLVTGGTGVLGRRVVDLLEHEGVETRVLSRGGRARSGETC